MHHPTDRITHTTAFVTPVMEHWLEREIAQWVRLTGIISELDGTRPLEEPEVHTTRLRNHLEFVFPF